MTLALAVTVNAVLMLALAGALAFVMSRPARLGPHRAAALAPALVPAPAVRSAPAHRAPRPSGALALVRS